MFGISGKSNNGPSFSGMSSLDRVITSAYNCKEKGNNIINTTISKYILVVYRVFCYAREGKTAHNVQ